MPNNTEYQSKNHRSRNDAEVEFLVFHYTAVPLNTTLGMFTNDADLAKKDAKYFEGTNTKIEDLCSKQVSAHYVVAEQGTVYNLVDEKEAAYHAGVSAWNGKKNINDQSIGIEHVNPGYKNEDVGLFPAERGAKVKGDDREWCHYTPEQIASTKELSKKIIDEHNIQPYNVVGHSDIACGRKQDPGPLFPWQELADAGIGIWYDPKESALAANNLPENQVRWMQEKLSEFGYDCNITGQMDNPTKDVVKAFQMHFRQNNINGEIDLESMQILDSLCQRKAALEQQFQQSLNNKPQNSSNDKKSNNPGMLYSFRVFCGAHPYVVAVVVIAIIIILVAAYYYKTHKPNTPPRDTHAQNKRPRPRSPRVSELAVHIHK